MFTSVSDRRSLVYHYTSAEKAVALILAKGRLLLGPYAQTNDPKETKQWTFGLGNLQENEPYISIDEISAQISAAIKLRAHVLCTSKDAPSAVERIGPELHSRGFARPRMWDQYGDRHGGVCLVFSRLHLDKLIAEQHPTSYRASGSVVYRDRPIVPSLRPGESDPYIVNMAHLRAVGLDQYARDHIVTHWKHLFFEKAVDWRDEHEFRWLVANDSDEQIFVHYGSSLSAIVFGQDCPESRLQEAVHLAKAHGASFEQLQWKNAAPWLSFRTDWEGM